MVLRKNKALSRDMESMIRVNQAGEYGACRIYQGQLSVLGKHSEGQIIKEMADQEENHLKLFNHLAVEHEVRPTFLQPLWHVLGYSLGAVSALMGKKYAHACTVAVEDVIDRHYRDQLETFTGRELTFPENDLKNVIASCHEDELHHREISELRGGADVSPWFSRAVRVFTKTAIFLSKRI